MTETILNTNDIKIDSVIKRDEDFNLENRSIFVDDIKKQRKKNPGRISADKKLAEHNRLTKIDL